MLHGESFLSFWRERHYAERYRVPRANPKRVVIEITVTRVLGNA